MEDRLSQLVDTVSVLAQQLHTSQSEKTNPCPGPQLHVEASQTLGVIDPLLAADDSAQQATVGQTPALNDMPPTEMLLSAADSYFENCHNQPYSLFHESSLRAELSEGRLPSYLVFAFLATAIRFSTDCQSNDSRFEAISRYAERAWKEIMLFGGGLEKLDGLNAIRALILLSVIDYTGQCIPSPLIILPQNHSDGLQATIAGRAGSKVRRPAVVHIATSQTHLNSGTRITNVRVLEPDDRA